MKSETIRARVEPALKRDAEAVFHTLGLSPTQAITLFYRQVTLHEGLPFAVRVPNKETLEAHGDAREEKNLTRYKNLGELKQAFE
ncbi:MAG: type II toxin-antitoxin system RelB/DinJ family antitoxin [Rhodospirillales bacterium]